ncbi:macro domain-containing protein [Paradesulfitobacterium aromaticivorans]
MDEVHLKINGTKIIVKIGDIFELMGKDAEAKKKEICVIPVNDYFDVIVDNRIVSETTLHGQYINRLIANDKLDALNKIIEEDEVLNAPENKTENPNREKGKKISYKLGSLIEFESYILAAFTKFDSKNKAFLSAEEYTTFWMRFWENTDQIYAGRTINLPLVGAGVTRFRNGKPSKQELLETMLWSLKISGFHNTYGFRSINIIIYKADASDIDFFHIQHNPNFR